MLLLDHWEECLSEHYLQVSMLLELRVIVVLWLEIHWTCNHFKARTLPCSYICNILPNTDGPGHIILDCCSPSIPLGRGLELWHTGHSGQLAQGQLGHGGLAGAVTRLELRESARDIRRRQGKLWELPSHRREGRNNNWSFDNLPGLRTLESEAAWCLKRVRPPPGEVVAVDVWTLRPKTSVEAWNLQVKKL